MFIEGKIIVIIIIIIAMMVDGNHNRVKYILFPLLSVNIGTPLLDELNKKLSHWFAIFFPDLNTHFVSK